MKGYSLLLALVFLWFKPYAQFNYHSDSTEIIQEVYHDLGDSGTAITTGYYGGAVDYQYGFTSPQNIGFDFYYNGKTFTQFILNADGYINLGTGTNSGNQIAPFAFYWLDSTSNSEFRVYTSGVVGLRICTIQFKKLKFRYSDLDVYSEMNFQIKLYEHTNFIEFVYGDFIQGDQSGFIFGPSIGIMGNETTNAVNVQKEAGASWSSAVFVDDDFYADFYIYNANLPVSGLTYRFKPFVFDVSLDAVYALGKNPVPAGSPEIIQARIRNKGIYPVTDFPVTLDISGDNIFSNTQKISISAQIDTVINFDAFSPYTIGSNNISVSVPDDDTVANNTRSMSQIVTSKTYSYADGSPSVTSMSVGTGLILTKYRINGTATVEKVNVHLNVSANEGNTVYAVVLDSAGNILSQSSTYITSAGELNQYKTFDIINPPVLKDAFFYVGLAQTTNDVEAYFPVSCQWEGNPGRPGAYYYTGIGGGQPVEYSVGYRFMIEAVLSSGLPINPYSSTPWTWIAGDSIPDVPAVYHSSEKKPGARIGAVSWTDKSDNFWIFGGRSSENADSAFNDLWRYDRNSATWVIVNGDTIPNASARYTAGDSATPGARSGSVSWVDKKGNLWLFGGNYGFSQLNDLWKYDLDSAKWQWIRGDSTGDSPGHQGLIRVGDELNDPAARSNAVSWADTLGNLWLFGGEEDYTFGEGSDQFNDLWKYSIDSSVWTWMGGSDFTNSSGFYGDSGVASATSMPGARSRCNAWVDKNGNFWLFGGDGYASNDLWKYTVASGEWAWMKGDTSENGQGHGGYLGFAAPENNPSARADAISWTASGQLWLYGGRVLYSTTYLNDLWKYDTRINQWTWVSGSIQNNEKPIYGSKGVEAKGSHPGSRYASGAWADSTGNLWLFGGGAFLDSSIAYNDLWKIYGGIFYRFIGDGSWDKDSNWVNNLVGPKNIPEGTTVIIDNIEGGRCITDSSISIQQFGGLAINQGKELDMVNGDLSNSGLLQGPGRVVFIGRPSNLNSSGTITAPLVLDNKTMDLAGHTNTNSIALLNHSFIRLNQFNLNMGINKLTADSVNFIVTNDTGSLNRTVSQSPVIFHIGTDTLKVDYSPAILTNSGQVDSFSARVEKKVVLKRPQKLDLISGNIDLTWHISEGSPGGSNVSMQLQWDSLNEQGGFTRDFCYISQEKNCEPPPNCDDGFYFDRIPGSPAQGLNPFYIIRDNIFNFIRPLFVVTSQVDTRTFTGNVDSDWTNPRNWTIGIVPESTLDREGNRVTIVRRGMQLIIDPIGGVCDFTGEIRVEEGGILTVAPGKILSIHQR